MLTSSISVPLRRFRDLAIYGISIAAILLCNLGVARSFEEAAPDNTTTESRDRGHAGGRASFDLPMALRAQLETRYSNGLYASDQFARPYVAKSGPRLRNDLSLENRISLTRSIAGKLEIGIVWGARSRLTSTGFFDFKRQTVGAMIRLVR